MNDLAGIVERDRLSVGLRDDPYPEITRVPGNERDAWLAAADRRALLALLRETREALNDANKIVSMTRQHLAQDHPECAYDALGVMNDQGRWSLLDRLGALGETR